MVTEQLLSPSASVPDRHFGDSTLTTRADDKATQGLATPRPRPSLRLKRSRGHLSSRCIGRNVALDIGYRHPCTASQYIIRDYLDAVQ